MESLKVLEFFCSKKGANLEFIIIIVIITIIINIIKVITTLVHPLPCPSPPSQSTLAMGASPWSQAMKKNLEISHPRNRKTLCHPKSPPTRGRGEVTRTLNQTTPSQTMPPNTEVPASWSVRGRVTTL